MHVLILLLLAMAAFLYISFLLYQREDLRRYFYFFVFIDLWICGVIIYLLSTAVLD